MLFLLCTSDSSEEHDPAEEGEIPEADKTTPGKKTRGRPRKYETELEADDARRERARNYYRKNCEKVKDRQKLYQHVRRNEINDQRRKRYAKKGEDQQ